MTITIVEVGPRDGLQNESTSLTAEIRAELIQKLASAGHQRIEVGAFVSPKWVPQMASTSKVIELLKTSPQSPSNPLYSTLTPNMKGLEAAIQSGIKEVAIFTAASESFTKKNINANIKESLSKFKTLCTTAHAHQIKVRGYISCVVHCPYEGFITPRQVLPVAEKLLELGCYELSLGDTTGRATPAHIRKLLTELKKCIPTERLAGHFHDTFGQGLSNALAALDMNIQTFDSSVAGLGGCPYSPGASGNLATEDLVYMLEGLGIKTGIDLKLLSQTGQWISEILKRPNNSKAGVALTSCQSHLIDDELSPT